MYIIHLFPAFLDYILFLFLFLILALHFLFFSSAFSLYSSKLCRQLSLLFLIKLIFFKELYSFYLTCILYHILSITYYSPCIFHCEFDCIRTLLMILFSSHSDVPQFLSYTFVVIVSYFSSIGTFL